MNIKFQWILPSTLILTSLVFWACQKTVDRSKSSKDDALTLSALYFSGEEGAYVTIPGYSLPLESDFSVCLWASADAELVKPSSMVATSLEPPHYGFDLAFTPATGTCAERSRVAGFQVSYQHEEDTTLYNADSCSDHAIDSAWHHYCATFNRTSFLTGLFLDGVEQKQFKGRPEEPVTLLPAATTLFLGRGFRGYMREVGIFKQTLTAEQVLALFKTRTAQSLQPLDRWSLSETSGRTASNSVRPELQGNLSGNVSWHTSKGTPGRGIDNLPEGIDGGGSSPDNTPVVAAITQSFVTTLNSNFTGAFDGAVNVGTAKLSDYYIEPIGLGAVICRKVTPTGEKPCMLAVARQKLNLTCANSSNLYNCLLTLSTTEAIMPTDGFFSSYYFVPATGCVLPGVTLSTIPRGIKNCFKPSKPNQIEITRGIDSNSILKYRLYDRGSVTTYAPTYGPIPTTPTPTPSPTPLATALIAEKTDFYTILSPLVPAFTVTYNGDGYTSNGLGDLKITPNSDTASDGSLIGGGIEVSLSGPDPKTVNVVRYTNNSFLVTITNNFGTFKKYWGVPSTTAGILNFYAQAGSENPVDGYKISYDSSDLVTDVSLCTYDLNVVDNTIPGNSKATTNSCSTPLAIGAVTRGITVTADGVATTYQQDTMGFLSIVKDLNGDQKTIRNSSWRVTSASASSAGGVTTATYDYNDGANKSGLPVSETITGPSGLASVTTFKSGTIAPASLPVITKSELKVASKNISTESLTYDTSAAFLTPRMSKIENWNYFNPPDTKHLYTVALMNYSLTVKATTISNLMPGNFFAGNATIETTYDSLHRPTSLTTTNLMSSPATTSTQTYTYNGFSPTGMGVTLPAGPGYPSVGMNVSTTPGLTGSYSETFSVAGSVKASFTQNWSPTTGDATMTGPGETQTAGYTLQPLSGTTRTCNVTGSSQVIGRHTYDFIGNCIAGGGPNAKTDCDVDIKDGPDKIGNFTIGGKWNN